MEVGQSVTGNAQSAKVKVGMGKARCTEVVSSRRDDTLMETFRMSRVRQMRGMGRDRGGISCKGPEVRNPLGKQHLGISISSEQCGHQ